MRWAAAIVVVLSGCTLYLSDGGSDDISVPVVDAPTVDAYEGCNASAAVCTDGVVTAAEFPANSCPDWDPPDVSFTCPGPCTTDFAFHCFDPGCSSISALCANPAAAPLPAPFVCDAGASCTGDATTACGGVDECGAEVIVGSCTCAGGVETCTDACADGLCGADAVQAALVGTWSGTVDTYYGTFTQRLTITADGHYISELPGPASVFQFGSDGAGDARRFHVIGQSPVGATALVRVFFGGASVQDGLARGLRIQSGHLTFDMYQAWLDCTRYAQYDLVREP